MNIMKRIIKRRYNLVFSFDEMENIFKALNSLNIQSNIACGNCGWKDADKWFVFFTATDYEMEKLFELIQEFSPYSYSNLMLTFAFEFQAFLQNP